MPGRLSMCGNEEHHSGRYVVLLIAMVFLGHDILMAGDAHARPDAALDTGHADHGQTTVPDSQHVGGQHPLASESEPSHEPGFDGCSATRQLVQRLGESLQLDAAPAGVLTALPAMALQFTIGDWWWEPTVPPDIVRALFQVFLI